MSSSGSESILHAFISRQRTLLAQERDAEIERTSLLLSNASPKLLEQRGLALGGLGIVSAGVGLGGKTLVELERPSAYHSSPLFPPHTFRVVSANSAESPGDLARIEENVSTTQKKTSSKGKKVQPAAADTKGPTPPEGVVYKVTDTRIVIAVGAPESGDAELDLPERCRVVKLANSVTYDRMDKAIDYLEKIAIPSTRKPGDTTNYELSSLVRVLLGMSPPSKPSKLGDITHFDESLNQSQKVAVRFALEAQEVACIHGPPGTGKTHTLIEIIRQLTSNPPDQKPVRVLVCGASNLSVDNILERLLALPPPEKGKGVPLKVTRIGHPARVMAREDILNATLEIKAGRSDQAALAKDVKAELNAALDTLAGKGKGKGAKKPRGLERKKMWEDVRALRKEYRQREGGVVKAVLSESQVVLATCHSAGGRQLRDHTFDIVIIDEATQAVEAVCWVPIFRGKKLILAGDPMQLPPTILSLDKHEKKNKQAKSSEKQHKDASESEATSTKLSKPNKSESSSTHDGQEDVTDPSSENVTAEQFTVPSTDTPKNPSEPSNKKTSKHSGLRPPRTLETTLFDRLERMYGPGIKRVLNVQYRMHAQICQFPSNTLYASKLKSHESVSSHLLCDLSNTRSFTETKMKRPFKRSLAVPSSSSTRLGVSTSNASKATEMKVADVMRTRLWWSKSGRRSLCVSVGTRFCPVMLISERQVGAGLYPSQIAIITPYQAQVTLLSSLLRPEYGPELEIGTVDGMQGREKDAVIISLVRSNDKREVGFLKEKRRMNGTPSHLLQYTFCRAWVIINPLFPVAMTRAKRHLCVVGDSSTVRHGGAYLNKWLAWLERHADIQFADLA
ncbi:putative DNA polymerase alpha-associated DNA helicase A [Boletus reticuloceps]|uniref:DNA helicase n=1 Tax=Boletus reticuloceps TaxID=495285 RepID=A0A8I3AF95_9AGAM|nr:putative DNA polymerase alpha-associated DNA helicase A [Boletus reticuloceps]